MSNEVAGHSDATTLMLNQTLAGIFPEMTEKQFPQVAVRVYSKR